LAEEGNETINTCRPMSVMSEIRSSKVQGHFTVIVMPCGLWF